MTNYGDISYGLNILGGQSVIRKTDNTGYEAKYIDADFYKYSITRTVDGSGNLTNSIKNYLGQTPSTTAPIKIQIGGVIRSITSDLSITVTAGTNWLNLGSIELANRETDLFNYFIWDNTLSTVGLLASRIPYANFWSDFVISGTAEKGVLTSSNVNPNSTDICVNIGRFNAILSAGPSYTWSLPATSVIINRPIYETRGLNYVPILSGSGGGTGNNIEQQGKYKIIGSEVFIQIRVGILDKGSLSGAIKISIPFGVDNNLSEVPLNGFYSNYGSNPTPGLGVPILNQGGNCISILVGVDTAAVTFEELTGQPRIRIKDSYNI